MAPDISETLQIMRLYARYAHAIDRGDGDAWSSCYSIDGTYCSSTFGECSGRNRLREFAIAHYERWAELGVQTRHWNNQILLEKDSSGNEICGSVYVLLMGVRQNEDPKILIQTVYSDKLSSEHGEWRLRERRSNADSLPDPGRFGFQRWQAG